MINNPINSQLRTESRFRSWSSVCGSNCLPTTRRFIRLRDSVRKTSNYRNSERCEV
jgi:hypothetical protein